MALVPADDEWVTQYVFADDEPRSKPRASDHDGLSVLRGQLTTEEAAAYVRLQVHTPYSGDAVRHASVKRLREAGFTVTLTPTRRNPIHTSVSREASWIDEDCNRFNSCFGVDDRVMEAGE